MFIDTVIWRLGMAVRLIVLIFATLLHFPTSNQLGRVGAAGGWLVQFLSRATIVATLRESISQHRLDVNKPARRCWTVDYGSSGHQSLRVRSQGNSLRTVFF